MLWALDTVFVVLPLKINEALKVSHAAAHHNAESSWWWQCNVRHSLALPLLPGISVSASASLEKTNLTKYECISCYHNWLDNSDVNSKVIATWSVTVCDIHTETRRERGRERAQTVRLWEREREREREHKLLDCETNSWVKSTPADADPGIVK